MLVALVAYELADGRSFIRDADAPGSCNYSERHDRLSNWFGLCNGLAPGSDTLSAGDAFPYRARTTTRTILSDYGERVTDTLVSIEGVTKRYGEVVAVSNLSLSIARGEVYALVGANGAGKSTLIRMLVGITEPDGGRLLICGEQITNHAQTTSRNLGYLPEELVLYERLTGYEYLELVAGLKDADASRIPIELEFFELLHAQSKLVGGFSLGMRKKLGLAAAMLGSPQLLVLDEPLN